MAKYDFYCDECHKYFDINLRSGIDGNYRIHCPSCGHIHYRVIDKGNITSSRFTSNDLNILIEDIRPMKSSVHEDIKETEDLFVNTTKGFLFRSWHRIYSGRI